MDIGRDIKSYIGLIIWLGIILSLGTVALIAINLNMTLQSESEGAFKKHLQFLSESSAKSTQMFLDGVISELVLLTEIDAVKKYESKNVDLAFRGVISKHDELISHMILLDNEGEINVMVTKDQEPDKIRPQIDRFFKKTMEGWRVNISKKLFVSREWRGIAIGMPIFRKVEGYRSETSASGIYASGMVMAIVGADDMVNLLIEPSASEADGFAWLYTEGGEILANRDHQKSFIKRLYGFLGDAEKFRREFTMALNSTPTSGWLPNSWGDGGMKIEFGDEKWLVAKEEFEIASQKWIVTASASAASATHLLNKSFMQLASLFTLVIVLLIVAGSIMFKLNKERVRADERGLYATELETKNTELNDLNKRMDEFLSIVSHDMKSPLNVIRGFLKMIRSAPGGEKFNRETSTMLRSSNRLLQLVSDILDVSRLEKGKVALAYENVDIDELVEESIKTMELIANEKEQKILVDLGKKTVIKADGAKLLQVINNLLGNAIKFTPRKGEIAVSKIVEGENLLLLVSDTGPGIPKEERETVFDKFEQVKNHQQGIEPGSGLGLSICKSIVELHGGSIDVSSRPEGTGSIFTVKIPQKMGNGVQGLLSMKK